MGQTSHLNRVIACIIILVLLGSLGACTPGTGRPVDNPTEIYTEALSTFTPEPVLYRIFTTKETTVGNELFIETTRQTVTYGYTQTQAFEGAVNETYTLGDHNISVIEVFKDSKIYLKLDNGEFYSEMSEQDFKQRYAPPVLISPQLYTETSGIKTKDGYTISFTAATAPEAWLNEPNATFVSATGTAQISKDLQLQSSVYEANYKLYDQSIRLNITTQIMPQPETVQETVIDTGSFVYLSDPDIPKLLEKACGQLLSAGSLESQYADTIQCEAFGDLHTQQIDICAVDSESWSSKVDTTVNLSNTGKTGADTTIHKSEHFIAGEYTLQVNGSSPSKDPAVDENTVRTLIQDILVGTVILPEQIAGTSLEEDEQSVTFTFQTTDGFAVMIRDAACEKLYADAQVLSAQSQSYTTDIATCYITLDIATGLPLASGFRYAGTYTIDALPYQLEYNADQHYRIADDNASTLISSDE